MTGRIAIIGAGSAGLATARALGERELDYVVFEARDGLGGNWRYEEAPGRGSAYASLTTNTSRRRTAFSGMPIAGRDLYATHEEMLAYLERFADRCKIRERIRFGHAVEEIREGWTVDGEDFDGVVVATGYNSEPVRPSLPGRFDGLEVHTHDYRRPDRFNGLDVLVVGMGCSAGELACEIADRARSVALAVRTTNWVLPRRLMGLPLDWLDTAAASRVPWGARRRWLAGIARLAGRSLPRASIPFGQVGLCMSDRLAECVRRGRVTIVAAPVELRGDRVALADGGEHVAEAIVWGTGYRASYPFLPRSLRHPTVERSRLYRGVTHPEATGLHFVGLVAGHGALMPMFEAQARWAAAALAGDLVLPSEDDMRASIAADDAVRGRDFARDGLFFDRLRYVRALSREAAAGRATAAPTVL